MCELTIATHGADSVQMYVRQARERALRSPEKWSQALHDLYGAPENDVIFAAMDGDEAHAGRVLIQRLRDAVIAEATDAAKDAAEEIADRESLTERRVCEAERYTKAVLEGTP